MEAAPVRMEAHASPVIFPILDLIDVLDVILADDDTVTKQRTESHTTLSYSP